MQGVYITKAAKFLPNDPISNDDMEDYLGMIALSTRVVFQVPTYLYAATRRHSEHPYLAAARRARPCASVHRCEPRVRRTAVSCRELLRVATNRREPPTRC